jgi:hypothetical protein
VAEGLRSLYFYCSYLSSASALSACASQTGLDPCLNPFCFGLQVIASPVLISRLL